MKCPFCGYSFEEAQKVCLGCPLRGQCKAVCCPNCGYELERESKLADLVRKVWGKESSESRESEESEGQEGI